MLELGKKEKETKAYKSKSTQVISFRGTLGDSVMICNNHDSSKNKTNGIVLLMAYGGKSTKERNQACFRHFKQDSKKINKINKIKKPPQNKTQQQTMKICLSTIKPSVTLTSI